MKIIDGKVLAEKIKDNIVTQIHALKGERPCLAIILVGEREDSKLYVKLKEEEAKKVGIDTNFYKCPDNITDAELLEMIQFLNNDKTVDAILIQLPLPSDIDTDAMILAMNKNKDVDGFHPDNVKAIFDKQTEAILSPVNSAVIEMLSSINCDLTGKNICIIANSDIFGRTMARILEDRGAVAVVTQSDDKSLVDKTQIADIIITAVGKPHYIIGSMIKQDAILIDIGITKKDKQVLGDVDFASVESKASYITPVPGGIGPMTIAMAFQNTLELYKRNRGKK